MGLALLACESAIGDGGDVPPDFGGGFGGSPTTVGGSPGLPIPGDVYACTSRYSQMPVFGEQLVHDQLPLPRVFYSWTTREQIAEMHRDRQLFLRSEQAGLGRGHAFQVIAALATMASGGELGNVADVARVLNGDLFAKIRYAWPNPWATRRPWPGEDYGDQLVRIELQPTAWVARVGPLSIVVLDAQNQTVPNDVVLRNPQRIGAIFFVKDANLFGPCGGTFGGTGAVTYREFILGNPAMVKKWAIGTDQIRERLVSDAEHLERFLQIMRPCPPFERAFSDNALCSWTLTPPDASSDFSAYVNALAFPTEQYAKVAEVATTIDMLRNDVAAFEIDPLVVEPGE